jgi:hypothetical protein
MGSQGDDCATDAAVGIVGVAIVDVVDIVVVVVVVEGIVIIIMPDVPRDDVVVIVVVGNDDDSATNCCAGLCGDGRFSINSCSWPFVIIAGDFRYSGIAGDFDCTCCCG